ncbi:MAG TPA: NRAMP family divalent metal transporter [Chloroflexota bacterium]|nr:NRAMP family divalent metal transporter [Chloroflexota bacterium]
MGTHLGTPVRAERSAVLDPAHRGDLLGALGTIRQHDTAPRRTWRARLLTLLAIMGPGLVVMVGDNDAGGVATYAQAGQNYGTSLLWTLLLLIPVLIVNQEMVVRLGAVTGVGHARLIFERFGRFWGWFSVGDLLLLNFLTLVTEFIGVSLALGYFGISPTLSVPLAALGLIAVTLTGSFRRWERFMFVFIVFNFLAIPLVLMTRPAPGPVLRDLFIPRVEGGLDSTALLLIISIVGTTVAPWQLFFQQSNIVDKRILPRWIQYERLDTVLGAVVTEVGAAALLIAAAAAFAGTPLAGQFTDAGAVASGLAEYVGPSAGALFALVLLEGAIIGGVAVSLATAYAFGDVFAIKHSLHRSATDAKAFYGLFAVQVVAAAGVVLIPNAPLGLITLAVQALAGVLLPSATVFLVLLCNDRAILGPWVNPRWLNVVASIIVGVLLLLSLVLMATTLLPDLDPMLVTGALGALLFGGLVVLGLLQLPTRAERAAPAAGAAYDSTTWQMPPLETLPKPVWSVGRKVALLTLRGYLLVAIILVVVKVVQLALGQ